MFGTNFAAKKRHFRCRAFQQVESLESRRLLAGDLPVLPANITIGDELVTYRLALASTGEFTAGLGGETETRQFMEGMVVELNRIYSRDMAIKFDLLPVIFTNAANDGYPATASGGKEFGEVLLEANQGVLDAHFGSNSAYDIGHVLGVGTGSSYGGGTAGKFGSQANGSTVVGNPAEESPAGLVQGLTAHEIGHQFHAPHTFNGLDGACSARAGYEPGSGNTVMSYEGVCGSDNLEDVGDNSYFHASSIYEIITVAEANKVPANQIVATGNQLPTITPTPDYSIPVGAPFVLTATAADQDGDQLTYTWEQTDKGDGTGQSVPIDAGDDGDGPIFRSFEPRTANSRTFPRIETILSAARRTNGERIPSTPRELNFRLTVRDNHAYNDNGVTRIVSGVAFDDVTVTVAGTLGESFTVQSANAALTGGDMFTVNWNVARSNLSPVNTSNVRVLMSTDGGVSFNYTLADSTPNTGTANVKLPNISSQAVRFKVEAIGNIYFNISDTNDQITVNPQAPGLTFSGNPIAKENGGTDTFTVSLNKPTNPPITVSVNSDQDTEVSLNGTDFNTQQQIVLDGNTPRTIHVRAIDDNRDEGPHRSLIRYSVANGNGEYPAAEVLTIQEIPVFDNELAPVVGVGFADRDIPQHWAIHGTGEFDPFIPPFSNGVWDNGVPSAIDFEVDVFAGNAGRKNIASSTIPIHTPSLASLDSYAKVSSGNTQSFTWKDLQAGNKYNVFVFTTHGDLAADHTVTILGSGTDNPAPFVQKTDRQNELLINGEIGSSSRNLSSYGLPVTADANGRIRIQIAPNGGLNHLILTGMAIQEVGSVTTPPTNNDNFSNAVTLTPGQPASVNTSGMSRETGEPAHADNSTSPTAWYKWTAAATGNAVVATGTSSYDTILGVYTGNTVGALQPIGSNDDVMAGNTDSRVPFSAQAGTTYYIAVAGYEANSGTTQLSLTFTPTTGSGTIQHVQVGSTLWGSTFRDALQAGNTVANASNFYTVNGTESLPWSNINQIRLLFDSSVGSVSPGDFTLTGAIGGTYQIQSATPDGNAVLLQLGSVVPRDTLTLTTGSNTRTLRILPGDVDGSGGVTVADVVPLRNGLGRQTGQSGYGIFADLNGSGALAINDIGPIRLNLGQSLPAVPAASLNLNRDLVDAFMEEWDEKKKRANHQHGNDRVFVP